MELNNSRIKRIASLKSWVFVLIVLALLGLSACTISYKFNGGTIDYTKTKSISVSDFPNMAELVYPPLSQDFSEGLRDVYTKQTRLKLLKKGGDMHLEGEITEYRLTPMAISADSYAAETKLTLTVKVRFTNNKNPEEDLPEKSYSASRNFSSTSMLTDVQDGLIKELIAEIVDNIYNDTVARW